MENEKCAVTLAGNHVTYHFLGAAVAKILSGIDQPHVKGKPQAQSFFFNNRRMSSLSEMPRTLAESRDDLAIRGALLYALRRSRIHLRPQQEPTHLLAP